MLLAQMQWQVLGLDARWDLALGWGLLFLCDLIQLADLKWPTSTQTIMLFTDPKLGNFPAL